MENKKVEFNPMVMKYRQVTAAVTILQTLLMRDNEEDKSTRRMRRIIEGLYSFDESPAKEEVRRAVMRWSYGRAMLTPDSEEVMADAVLIAAEFRDCFEEISGDYLGHPRSVLTPDQLLGMVFVAMPGFANADLFGVIDGQRGEGRPSLFTEEERVAAYIAGRNKDIFVSSAISSALRWIQLRIRLIDAGIGGEWCGAEDLLFTDPSNHLVYRDFESSPGDVTRASDRLLSFLTPEQHLELAGMLRLYRTAFAV